MLPFLKTCGFKVGRRRRREGGGLSGGSFHSKAQ